MVENLWLSAIYNMIAVPIAILGFVDAADRRAGDVRLVDAGDAAMRCARVKRGSNP